MSNIETKTVTFDVDAELEAKLQELQREGWGILPGVKPTTTYTLVRAIRDAAGGQAALIVHEEGVHIMPAEAHTKKTVN